MRFTTFYGYAKVRSGELRPGIKTVEETVKSVVGLVNEKFRLVPNEILRHTDTDQDNQYAGHRTPVANIATTSKMAGRLYAKCEPVAEKSVASAWQKVKQSPMLHRMASVAAPKVACCTEKYNEAVLGAAEKGCRVSVYLPLVQIERIAKMFSEF
ncbi:stress-related protein-like [Cicer arietinum]|uniref:Stress-related protein-like n=1 Tax=Cicer arietinum TaxID=3827 RepID=A0A1S2YHX2_CICAR|nr:stress-related protein-like [Cicer arietinum]